ncbi:MAG: GNAT family N-acetyltransferase [Oscillochloridaceae bacterium umkhey_bin13]
MSRWQILDPQVPGWTPQLDQLWTRLDPTLGPLVPLHFVKSTFVNIGGRIASDGSGGIGLLFPRGHSSGRRSYSLRLQSHYDPAALLALLAPDRVSIYRPAELDQLTFQPDQMGQGGFEFGTPARDELAAMRALHHTIWGGPDDARYPDDLHSAELGPATSLVARREGQLVGFLLGFHRFELPALAGLGLPYRLDLGVESQVLAVDPAARRFGLAATLKREQARRARAAGLDLIHWTTDPLQFANAALNFGRLRAVAGQLYRSYYPFQNNLNRVTASRLGIVWLLRSSRGRSGMSDSPRPASRSLAHFPGLARLNRGPEALPDPGPAPHLALEIPADWNALQHDDLALASRWRALADDLLEARLGFGPGRYVVGDVASEGDQRFVIAHRYEPGLLL